MLSLDQSHVPELKPSDVLYARTNTGAALDGPRKKAKHLGSCDLV